MKLDVVFVCQHGDLEVMACLLAASLRRHCDNQVNVHLIEPIPEAEYGRVSAQARKFLDSLGAKWYPFRNPISDDYKIFNKLNAFNIQPESEKILFLDSDIVIRRPFVQEMSAYFSRPFAAKSAGKQRFAATADGWAPVYKLFDLPVPKMRWPATASHQWGPPYLNAGVILADVSLDFSTHWIDTCLRIHGEKNLPIENRGTVQIGLPVVLYRRHIPYALLDKRFNFGLSKGWFKTRRPWGDDEAFIVHYFKPENLAADPVIHREVSELVRQYKLQEILSLTPGGEQLLMSFERIARSLNLEAPRQHSSFFKPAETASISTSAASMPDSFSLESRMIFATGIPNSGTRMFAALLAELPNVSVVNEQILHPQLKHLNTFEQLWDSWLAWRKELNLNESSMLATQNSLYYLSWLPTILKTFPQAMIFILVRHPFETISGWSKTPELNDAKFIDEDAQGGMNDPLLSDEQKRHLSELRDVADPAMKRAGVWDYFSILANTHAQQVHIFRYEDVIGHPKSVLRYACEKLFPGHVVNLPEMNLQKHEAVLIDNLSEWDKECIRAIGSHNAGVFGYHLYEE